MELDEDLAVPVPSGMDALTHRISVARLQHVSNLAWCLGSWLPHLVSLAVLLIRLVRQYVIDVIYVIVNRMDVVGTLCDDAFVNGNAICWYVGMLVSHAMFCSDCTWCLVGAQKK